MAQEDNQKVRRSSARYNPTRKKAKGEFSCSWSTLWTAIGVIVAALGGLYLSINKLVEIQLKPIERDLRILRDEIKNNEANRDKNITLHIQKIEEKIEGVKDQCK